MDQLLAALRASSLFLGLTNAQLEKLVLCGCCQDFSKDQILIAPLQKVDRIGIVVSGRIHVQHIFENGNRSLMGVIGHGEPVGADLICTPSRISPYHAIAAAQTRLFYLPSAILLKPGTIDEEIRLNCMNRLLMHIANENMKKEYRLAILSQNGLRDRITTYLTMQARRRGENSFTIPFSREEMASFLCVNRSALSHELGLMRSEGIIEFRKNCFTLLRWKPE